MKEIYQLTKQELLEQFGSGKGLSSEQAQIEAFYANAGRK